MLNFEAILCIGLCDELCRRDLSSERRERLLSALDALVTGADLECIAHDLSADLAEHSAAVA